MARSKSRSPSPSRSRSPIKRKASPPPAEEPTCPFLIRVFITKGKHAPMLDFDEGKFPLRDEFQVYGWKTSTPTSLIQLLYPSFPPPYRSPFARFSFRHIYVDASSRGLYRSRDLVTFTGRDLMATIQSEESTGAGNGNGNGSGNGKVSMDMELDDTPDNTRRVQLGRKVEEKTLDGYGFITGDLISVSLHVPEPKVALVRPAGLNGGLGNGGGIGVGQGVRSFGWDGGERGGRGEVPVEKDGTWARGEALPPQGFRGGRGGGLGGDGFRGGPRGGGLGIRGSGRRSPEGRDRDRERERERSDRRSRSPDTRGDRRVSWSRR